MYTYTYVYLYLRVYTYIPLTHICVLFRFEDYLIDNFYREGNFDLQAQDVLLEFGLNAPVGAGV